MPEFNLPFHPRTGLQAVGLLRNGVPIWPVLGGSVPQVVFNEPADEVAADNGSADDADSAGDDSDAAGGDDGQDADTDDADDGDKPLGPKGTKALLAEKEKARTLRATVRQLKSDQAAKDAERDAELAALRKQVDKLTPKPSVPKKDAEAPESPPVDVEELRREAREQVEAELKTEQARERVLDKIELKATRTFIDPSDAVARLLREKDINDFIDDGKPDVDAIQDALEDLLQRAPHLAVTAQGDGKRFKGSGDGGAKPSKPSRPKSLGEAISRELTKS